MAAIKSQKELRDYNFFSKNIIFILFVQQFSKNLIKN